VRAGQRRPWRDRRAMKLRSAKWGYAGVADRPGSDTTPSVAALLWLEAGSHLSRATRVLLIATPSKIPPS
jgi:hypothetical protein